MTPAAPPLITIAPEALFTPRKASQVALALETQATLGDFAPMSLAVKPIVRADRRVGNAEIHAER